MSEERVAEDLLRKDAFARDGVLISASVGTDSSKGASPDCDFMEERAVVRNFCDRVDAVKSSCEKIILDTVSLGCSPLRCLSCAPGAVDMDMATGISLEKTIDEIPARTAAANSKNTREDRTAGKE